MQFVCGERVGFALRHSLPVSVGPGLRRAFRRGGVRRSLRKGCRCRFLPGCWGSRRRLKAEGRLRMARPFKKVSNRSVTQGHALFCFKVFGDLRPSLPGNPEFADQLKVRPKGALPGHRMLRGRRLFLSHSGCKRMQATAPTSSIPRIRVHPFCWFWMHPRAMRGFSLRGDVCSFSVA
jgi:hypothetical protein